MLSYTRDEMKELLQSVMVDGNTVKRVDFEQMVRKPFVIFHLDTGVGKPVQIAIPTMHLDMRRSREDSRY